MSGTPEEIFSRIISDLNFEGSDGFIDLTKNPGGDFEKASNKLGIDAVYQGDHSRGKSTIIYFKTFEEHDDEMIKSLYNSVWNEGRASLLILILPKFIKVYNPNAKPVDVEGEDVDDNQARLIDSIDLRNKAVEEASDLTAYDRKYFDSEEFWRTNQGKFVDAGRIDKYLHSDLVALKDKLEDDEGLPSKFANSLIIRTIFVLFLEDRDVLGKKFYQERGYDTSISKILPSKTDLYDLFDDLDNILNGDVFKYQEGETEAVSEDHLSWVKRFVEGEDVRTEQRRLFPYSFDLVPVELISSIYENFVPSDGGVYYTPYYLVDYILDDISDEMFHEDAKVLDPACGSGVFLVAAFEKFIQTRLADGGRLEDEELINILEENIVGVDTSPEAVRITSFSLSLKLLEYLEIAPDDQESKLPILTGNSIHHEDFFDSEPEFNGSDYDLIIGNPPWIRDKKSSGIQYCEENNLSTGNNQVALSFLWKSLHLLREDGEACLLSPTKDLLLNKRTREFREQFFSQADMKTIVNLSLLRKDIFENAVGPTSIVKFGKDRGSKSSIQYITPSHQPIDATQHIKVDPGDVKYIPRPEAEESIWKAAMFGGARDLDLIRNFSQMDSLGEFVEKFDLHTGEGFQAGGPKNVESQEIQDLPHIGTRKHNPFWIDNKDLAEYEGKQFHRPREGTQIWYGPRVLIKEGITTRSYPFFRAAFIETDATFRHNIMAVKGDENHEGMLKILSLVLNSSIAQYYFFMTSSTWGVERDIVEKNEIMNFPFPREDLACYKDALVDIHDSIIRELRQGESDIADLESRAQAILFDAYGLRGYEKILIDGHVPDTMEYFYKRNESEYTSPPNTSNIREYLSILTKYLTDFLEEDDRCVHAEYYEQNVAEAKIGDNVGRSVASPLNVVTLQISGKRDVEPKKASTSLVEKVDYINKKNIRFNNTNIYFERNNIIFDEQSMHVIKPNETRFWTRSSAVNDVNWILGDLIKQGGALLE